MRLFAFALIALFSLSGLVLAHGGAEHVRGTVTQITDKAITVHTAGKPANTIALLADTTFTKSGAAATMKDLKVGDRVVVHVVMKGKDMTAKTVEFGAASPAKKTAEHEHKTGRH